ncbi:MAG: DUF948 domain-containing protein [Bifidobacteriaceae bacterium]|jgi:uncharacterized protein YoxC|nr:DUF948 domain-containing protein [Bifidobacteriaceae bacterium]
MDYIGPIAGLAAAAGFLILVGLLAVPIIKLGRVLDETRVAVKSMTDHTMPILDEATTSVAGANAILERAETVTTAAAEVSQNVSALTALFAATIGSPIIKVAAFTYGVRSAFTSRRSRS